LAPVAAVFCPATRNKELKAADSTAAEMIPGARARRLNLNKKKGAKTNLIEQI